MSNVGFVGLGTMGASMARRLVEAGHDVSVWNRSPGPTEKLVAAGARSVERPEDAFDAGIVFSMLPNDSVVEAVFSEEMLAAASESVHVNMATVSLESTRRLTARHEQAGVGYVAAPVLGRPELAASGKLNIVAAGPEWALDRATEHFAVMGKRTWRIGSDPAQASLVKIGVNYNLIHTLQALAESINLMERGGVDGTTFVEVLTDAAFTGSAYGGYGPLIANRKYTPQAFSLELGLKDLTLAQAAAAETSAALPTAAAIKQVFQDAIADPELTDLDWSAMAEIVRKRTS